ncbi:MAG: hypothetical protein H0U44_03905 [Flavisolibacter sp.]|jgi:hypothetical protein|nr:hypothetical protein [Flavisolibacter sp.]
MSKRIHALAQHFFGKDSLEDCSLEDVRALAQKYPYASAAQFLLLEKLKSDEGAFAIQAQKTILYYHDPLTFHYFIQPERFYTEVPEELVEEPEVEIPGNETFHPENNLLQQKEDEATHAASFQIQQPEIEDHSYPTPLVEVPQVLAPERSEQKMETSAGAFHDEQEEKADQVIDQPSNEYAPVPEIDDEPGATIDLAAENATLGAMPATSISLEKAALDFKAPLPEQKADDKDLSFEPFHTVDYFASQGIKLSQEDFSKDKFGKQLKSFTEWLKSMKRISPTEDQPSADPGTENKVQHLAEDSIHKADVYTEAMAEVWKKQGNKVKAIEVYNKLSLMNPSKKAYFAAQIENLKRS